jgi:hypothetical protein
MDINLENVAKADETAQALSGKVDKETGKGLSSNDFTALYKTKLEGVEDGAEINVQSDWNESDNTKDSFIKNKPVTGSFGGSLLSLFLYSDNSDITGYKKALTVPSSGISQSVGVNSPSGETTITKFATELNYPNQEFLNSGFFKTHFHASKSSSSGNIKIYAKIYKRDLAGAETLITKTSLTASELTTSIVDYNCEVYKSTITDLLTSDRIVIEFIAVNSGGGSPTVTIFFENGYDSRFDIPVTAVDPNLFEKTENKTTTIIGNETSIVKFPTVKAIIDFFTGSKIRELLGVTTLSGSNTGDQDLSGLQPTLVSGANIRTINGSSLLGSGDITIGASYGVWGIANVSGIYTYYSTFALARAAASSGQVIELFADITENTNSYILKDGVNIEGHGHTVYFTNTGQGFTDNNTAVNCEFSNIKVKRTDSNYYCLYIDSNSSKINGNYSLTIINTNSTGTGVWLDGELSGVYVNCANGVRGEQSSSNLYNFSIKSFGTGYGCYFSNYGYISNGVIESTSTNNYCISGNYYGSNLKIKSNGFHAANLTDGNLTNSYIKSITSFAINSNGGKISNCTIESNGSYAVNGGEYESCSIISTVNFAVRNDSTYLYNCKLTTLLKACCGATNNSLIAYNTTFHCKWNNSAGHGIANLTTSTIVDCNFIITSSSAYAITNDYLAPNVVMFGNKIKGTSNFYNASFITQAQTNNADTKGNIILN